MIELSEKTRKFVGELFDAEHRALVCQRLMTECADNLPLCEDATPKGIERLRFAVLKLSEGRLDKLSEAMELARIDWRDLLVAAGFGDDTNAHKKWRP